MNSPQLRQECAAKLLAAEPRVAKLTAFVGVDGFVDEIIHAVDKRESAEKFERIRMMKQFADRIAAAAGKSTNIELATQQTKLGGNGPIMANALASLGLKVTYLGALGYPTLHPVFSDFAKRVEVGSIAEASHTDAVEFDDGKLMFGKMTPLKEVTWENIQARYGREKFAAKFRQSDLVGFVNWTMIPYMSELWDSLLKELCASISGPRRKIFFDLADPEKRTREDILRALDLIKRFEKCFDVILGLNEKESFEIAKVMGLRAEANSPSELAALACEINRILQIDTLVIHPVSYALAVSADDSQIVEGPFIPKPLITTGAGDHFNSGFCLGKLLGFDNAMSVLTGVTTSGFYVRTAQSPTIRQLAGMMQDWPEK
jgi:sugar/nucleoside kinase (ribokinase family)